MKKPSKRHQAAVKLVEPNKNYTLPDAIGLLKKFPRPKFDESVELHFQLGIKPDQTDEVVRGSVALPHGSGRSKTVVCFCKGEEVRSAQAAGAEHVGGEELVAKIQGGWMDFDAVVAHPDMMREVSKLGRVLGPKGLMPSPKNGTVTPHVAKAVKEIKAGKIDFKSDKTAGIHVACGKVSFSDQAILENAAVAIKAVYQAKPQSAKGDYVKRVYLSATQSPGISLELSSIASKQQEE